MKTYYFAAFMPEPNGGFDIIIPDVPRAFTCAPTLNESVEMASAVLDMMLRDLVESNKPLPEPSTLDVVKEKVQQHLHDIEHTPTGEILYQLIPAPELDETPVKVTISLAKSTLDEIDRQAKSLGYTRSGFLSKAAQVFTASSR